MGKAFEPWLVQNDSSGNHLNALRHVIANATTISMAVAFLKSKGLEKILGELRASLGAGAEVEMFIGCDFCLTDPKALEKLLELSKIHASLKIYAAKMDARSTFHPKVYLGQTTERARLMVGSANMTGGALGANEELSLFCELDVGGALLAQMQGVFSTYRSNSRFEELDAIVLEVYRRKHKIAQDAKRRVEAEIAASDANTFDLTKLTELYEEFDQDPDETAALEKRRRDRKSARSIQRKIAKMKVREKISQSLRRDFESMFRDLITSGDGHRHLWNSGDIHRRGQAALSQPKKTIALFSLAEAAAKLPPEEGYAMMLPPARKIEGVGINMLSEILCTFAPARYAVFNSNTAAALSAIGAEPPKSVTLFSPVAYARVCGIVESVRRRIGGGDLSDADAFLNWIYQTKVKSRS